MAAQPADAEIGNGAASVLQAQFGDLRGTAAEHLRSRHEIMKERRKRFAFLTQPSEGGRERRGDTTIELLLVGKERLAGQVVEQREFPAYFGIEVYVG